MIRIYQTLISPALHLLVGPLMGCRYHLTCSEYAKECFKRFNIFKATQLSAFRILSCHPFSKKSFWDDVPKAGD